LDKRQHRCARDSQSAGKYSTRRLACCATV
jgi:hypothetical protein